MLSASDGRTCRTCPSRRVAKPAHAAARRPGRYSPAMAFHDLTMTSITGDQVNFDEYRGKMALVVNVASN